MNKKKVIVAMSGGVDSSVTAYLLKKQGYHVEGLFMKNWEEDDNHEENCSSFIDFEDAKSVCKTIGIKIKIINFSAEYWENVFKNFLKEYKNGKTPNPDVLCNKEIKFKTFLNYSIKDLNADYIATGHYVRKKFFNGKEHLLRGMDRKKDQSYFLYLLNQKQIKKSLFPLGDLYKNDVRNIAKKLQLTVAKKKGSTGICFIGKRKFKKFLSHYFSEKPGLIKTIDQKVIGKHNGIMFYTIGQRQGLGIGGIKQNNNLHPWYVVEKNVKKNILIVAQGSNNPLLMSTGLIVKKVHWIDNNLIKNLMCCTVQIRYCKNDYDCKVEFLENKKILVTFNQPISMVTPGQSAVFYLKEICLGGGIIDLRLPLVKN
ncbi:tRNA 2-thiouridine(34) synthase MnmA [Candidatus Tachikawaea gelatinosa]|uniref:tRNA-specific 2-thiouridylase MnmA n=1 Tax=Candidatus Tachikawaea gelatinosa TaxID=1410383 RepID=A0A090AR63_9ENTR|nr:tRNA 2-thiouridine(34) synthase MnmA [Candidatus Tachikawaea gelatinosa]BAP58862.1 tRNA-specific 2-thiouridylase MnmA [Candidatus Tachikawaea gelatinosa]